MPPRDWRARLDDALQAARKIQRYVTGMSQEALRADERVDLRDTISDFTVSVDEIFSALKLA